MGDVYRPGDGRARRPARGDSNNIAAKDHEQGKQMIGQKDSENASKIVRGTTKSRSYRIAMNMPAGMSAESSSNNTENTEPAGSKEPGPLSSVQELRTDVAEWTETSINGRHLWVDTDASGNICYLTDHDCLKSGPRKKCAACKIIVHSRCIEQLEKINFKCKLTFREINPKGFHENIVRHHWVHRRKQEGRCNSCGKSFQHMLSFQSKDIIAISCSWCKTAYHNKTDCFGMEKIEEFCDLGAHANVIVPPSWVVKLPPLRKGRQTSMKRNTSFRKNRPLKRKSTKERRPFVIKPSGSAQRKPLLVFINPRSGGNQGIKIMHKFQWLLNPRQVFDLNRGGPKTGLELYRKVPNLRILACGGDGTVGWVLSELDKLKIVPPPPVAVLPLGTGNDLSRFLCWGGGYADEPLSKILMHVEEGKVVQLDRWNVEVTPNDIPEVGIQEDLSSTTTIEKDDDSTGETSLTGKPNQHKQPPRSNLPLNVVNNYFSLGFDAEVCLEFHETREAHPDKFNSRLGNLFFYGKAGSKSYLQRESKGFFKKIKLECDGEDLTEKLQELKPLVLLFLNISKYSAGTEPWGNPGRDNEFLSQRCDDGYLEVIGLTSTSLATTRVGTGHGERLAQCKHVTLLTGKTLPFQVDGEPCRLLPSKIKISRRNQVNMVERVKHRSWKSTMASGPVPSPENVRVQIYRVTFKDYEKHCYDLKDLRETATVLATTEVEPDSDLEKLRSWIDAFRSEEEDVLRMIPVPTGQKTTLSDRWCFLDTTYPDRVYRLDIAQENIYNVVDILEDGIFVVDFKDGTQPDPKAANSDPPSSPNLASATNCQQPAERPLYERNVSSVSESVEDITETTVMTPFCRLKKAARKLHITTLPRENAKHLDKKFTLPSGKSEETEIWVKHPNLKRDENAMIEAAKSGDLQKVIQLHRSGTSLSIGDQRGWRPLHYAARHGYKDIVRYIISNVPRCVLDLVEEEKGQTALHKAAFYERRTICSILVQAGASLTRTDYVGNTPKIQAKQAKDLAKYLETQEHLQIIASEDFETAV